MARWHVSTQSMATWIAGGSQNYDVCIILRRLSSPLQKQQFQQLSGRKKPRPPVFTVFSNFGRSRRSSATHRQRWSQRASSSTPLNGHIEHSAAASASERNPRNSFTRSVVASPVVFLWVSGASFPVVTMLRSYKTLSGRIFRGYGGIL